jgi:hypothetical protein
MGGEKHYAGSASQSSSSGINVIPWNSLQELNDY